jgi:hypothetical protein
MAFIDGCLAEERHERDERIKEDLYEHFLEGKTDAAFSRMPEYNDETYLEGYIAGLRNYLLILKLKNSALQSSQPFAFGSIDGDPEYRDQFDGF